MKTVNVSIVPTRGLGDSLIFLLLANNLQRNGYKVTFFNNCIYQLKNWVPAVAVRKLPEESSIEAALSGSDLVIADSGSMLGNVYKFSDKLMKRLVFVNMEININQDLIFSYDESNFPAVKNQDKLKKILQLTKASGSKIGALPGHPLVNKMIFFCREILQLNDVTSDVGMNIPNSLIYRKYPKRVTIHPTSSSPRRNWPQDRFLKFAKALQEKGWQPAICVEAEERSVWDEMVNGEFLLPKFDNIKDLAAFIYESGYMVGNDSGSGHLASCLKIPTLIVWKKFNNRRWSPGWFASVLVSSPFKIPFVHTYCWYYLVPVRKVLKGFKILIEKYKNQDNSSYLLK